MESYAFTLRGGGHKREADGVLDTPAGAFENWWSMWICIHQSLPGRAGIPRNFTFEYHGVREYASRTNDAGNRDHFIIYSPSWAYLDTASCWWSSFSSQIVHITIEYDFIAKTGPSYCSYPLNDAVSVKHMIHCLGFVHVPSQNVTVGRWNWTTLERQTQCAFHAQTGFTSSRWSCFCSGSKFLL